MGGSGGIFGSSKQKSAGGFKMSREGAQGEMEVINRLRAISDGTGQTTADKQMQANTDTINNQAISLAASSRGASNPALAFRTAQNLTQQSNVANAQQAAILAQQERMRANELILGQAAAQRGVALNSATANQQADTQKRGQDMQLIGNLGAAGAVALSDEDLKKDKKPTKESALRAVEEFLNSVEPYEYKYKGGDKVSRKGVMAQDLEDSDLGKQMVVDTPKGKVVDYGQGFSAMMAGLAELNQKIKKIEKKGA